MYTIIPFFIVLWSCLNHYDVCSFVPTAKRSNNHNFHFHPSSVATTKTTTRSFTNGMTKSDGRLLLSSSSISIPRLNEEHIKTLAKQDYIVIEDFLPSNIQDELRQDVKNLREKENAFKIAKIGQDSTNTLNQQIRVAETCFIGSTKSLPDNNSRDLLINILQKVSEDLSGNQILKSPKLDTKLNELLYAYYPKGGFYRRHRDAIPGSASVLRKFSLLLYLNKDWKDTDGGYLRMHMDSGGDELPQGEEPNFLDVEPKSGTLVLFNSEKIPHEVLDTNSERLAVVGWYNRELLPTDIAELGGPDPIKMGMLALSAGLVTVGLINLLS